MALYTISALIIQSIILMTTLHIVFGKPGHVHHRIHVPTKVKTVYHTKIIKVPEHHHYFHEKEKPHLVKIPEHHHYFHEEEPKKAKKHHQKHIEFPPYSWKKPALDLYDNHDASYESKEDDNSEQELDSYSSYSQNYKYEQQTEPDLLDYHGGRRKNSVKRRAPQHHSFYRKHRRSRP